MAGGVRGRVMPALGCAVVCWLGCARGLRIESASGRLPQYQRRRPARQHRLRRFGGAIRPAAPWRHGVNDSSCVQPWERVGVDVTEKRPEATKPLTIVRYNEAGLAICYCASAVLLALLARATATSAAWRADSVALNSSSPVPYSSRTGVKAMSL